MLNRDKLLTLIEKISPALFATQEENQIAIAIEKWQQISYDKTFAKKVEDSESSFLLPRWQENLASTVTINNNLQKYAVLGVDGSQVYPDRHISGIGCCLINTGGCLINYETPSSVQIFSEPHVFLPEQLATPTMQDSFSTDLIDLKREACEFETAFEKSLLFLQKQQKQATRFPYAFLLDGSLIFWHLEGKPPEIKNLFLQIYLLHMQKFYDHAMLMAGYISMPKSRELINLIRLGLCRFERANCIPCHSNYTNFPCKDVDAVLDSHLCSLLLPMHTRTIIFYSTSKITEHYPDHLKPCFFYLNVGSEIIRIEVPFWQTNDPSAIELICQIAINQAQKGYGYPVVLAEAHEQAVIHSHDRNFFYHLMHKRSIEHHRRILMSPKSIKKKGIGY